jgi:hypothetical protein
MNARTAFACAGIALLGGGVRATGTDQAAVIQDVTAAPLAGTSIQRNGVRWTELYDAAGYADKCGTPENTDWCVPAKLLVRNETAMPIVCHGEIRMPSPSGSR